MHLYVRDTSEPLAGAVPVPSSKYHAHRALILASLAEGETEIVGSVSARHVQWTVDVLRRLGTEIVETDDGLRVRGGRYRPIADEVSVGSSGTTLYFMLGLASLADAPVTIKGQKYFQRRPVGPLLGALEALGLEISSSGATPPFVVSPRPPRGGRVSIDGRLSQWISALLLLAPFAARTTVVDVEGDANELTYVELTVRMMRQFGLEVDVAADWRHFEIPPNQEARPSAIELPPDLGSAAFGLAACALHSSDVRFAGLRAIQAEDIDHPEADLVDVVAEMGLPLALDESGHAHVRHDGAPLRGIDIDCRSMPDMLPALTAIAQFAEGETRFHNVEHVRLKESDRVVSMLQLNRIGGAVEVRDDKLVVSGVEGPLRGAPLSSFNDHRVQMALAVAATRAIGPSSLTYPRAHRISYPGFLEDMRGIGLKMAVGDSAEVLEAPQAARASAPAPETVESIAIEQSVEVPLADWVARWAHERPDQPAVVEVRREGTRTWSWSELELRSDALAMKLLELGVEPGEVVAYQLPNWAEFTSLTLAIAKVGAVGCALMPIFREREVAHALRRSGARVLAVADRFRGRDHLAETVALLGGAEPGLGVEHVLVAAGAAPRPLPADDGVRWHRLDGGGRRADREALAARRPATDTTAHLFFTSGTSGEPKGVLHRYDTLTRAAFMEVEHLGLGREDRMFIPTPLAHQTGFLYGMWLAFVLGSTQILQDVWDPGLGIEALRRWEGTFVQAATPFLADIVRGVEEGEQAPPALRLFVVTGAAVPRALAARATETLSAAVCGAWGSTESCLAALADPADDPAQIWGADGRALAGTELRVTDEDGRELEPGEEGNFEVRSRCLFEGYLGRPDLTEAAFTPDGWYRTGDLATIDADGYLRITGRVNDVINRGGEKVPVAEIEQLLYEHPAIEDVAIVAMPDDRLGERACAFVVLADSDGEPFDLAAARKFLDERRVSRHYWPERVEPTDALPRTPSGKIQKFVLRERAASLQAESPESAEKEPMP
ncbi:MAG: 3-phosphoshikimate 1-carboxyvinyltransferase [Solirubrobacterales bacterium]